MITVQIYGCYYRRAWAGVIGKLEVDVAHRNAYTYMEKGQGVEKLQRRKGQFRGRVAEMLEG